MIHRKLSRFARPSAVLLFSTSVSVALPGCAGGPDTPAASGGSASSSGGVALASGGSSVASGGLGPSGGAASGGALTTSGGASGGSTSGGAASGGSLLASGGAVGGSTSASGGAPSGGQGTGGENSFPPAKWKDMAYMLNGGCAGCHNLKEMLNLVPEDGTEGKNDALYKTLTTFKVPTCGNLPLITPNDPSKSAMLKLLNMECTKNSEPFFMPPSCGIAPCFPDDWMAQITGWIAEGAPQQ